ncbi:MAG: MerR family mercuric resistance operon transcriptional regulator [Planctomycetota bacterium]|jgi:MerR family mercuric resistance operon transcriptional regulator
MSYTIGQLAQKADINVETIRYYERCGLIAKPQRPAQGYRQYNEPFFERLQFIKRAKTLGFKLVEIKNLLSLADASCADVESLAQQKLIHIRERIGDLKRLEQVLHNLVEQCGNQSDQHHCPIIETLQQDH